MNPFEIEEATYLYRNYYTDEMQQLFEDIKYGHLSKKQQEIVISPIRNSAVDPKQYRNAKCLCGSGKKYKQCCERKK